MLSAVLGGRVHRDTELTNRDVSLIVRAIPLRPREEHIGAIILVRDVTELRRRERELITKDATIREIHHRVKNNLQTVAALLRLQGRRLDAPDARSALEEAERRVGPIASVHETLSESGEETVEFDEVARPARPGWSPTSSAVRWPVRVQRDRVVRRARRPRLATALAMVLTEVLQNAVEHAWPGRRTRADRALARRGVRRTRCVARSWTTGTGCRTASTTRASGSLGLSIVRTLVESELGGRLSSLRDAPAVVAAPAAVVDLPLG